jgi:ABC-type antimicrobial peptide transport system permease subunit
MNWQSRLEKTVITLNLIGLALGFGTLGILILLKGEHAGKSSISGLLGIVVGSLFLLFAFYFYKHTRGICDRSARPSSTPMRPPRRTGTPSKLSTSRSLAPTAP